MADDPDFLAILEKTKDAVATMTGFRQQFIDAGWEPANAERAVIVLLEASARQ
jgi:hypothetical protein